MKPPYRMPSMAEIAELPKNGLRVASLFSGCGGSSLGYKMAGCRVLWANEFIPAAATVYRANHPDTILDTRDVRTITADEILDATGMRAGELDILDGSPPCASFSTAGKRDKAWGAVKKYSTTKQRTDDLFFEYARLLAGIQPRFFVAENVTGLLKGRARGYYALIRRSLEGAGYRVGCRVLNASMLGVPQARQRVIFVGVRRDIDINPPFPSPLPYAYTVKDALPWLASQDPKADHWQLYGGQGTNFDNKGMPVSHDKPAPTITTNAALLIFLQIPPGPARRIFHTDRLLLQHRNVTIAELRKLCGFPDDFQLFGPFSRQWERLGRAVPPPMMKAIASAIYDASVEK